MTVLEREKQIGMPEREKWRDFLSCPKNNNRERERERGN